MACAQFLVFVANKYLPFLGSLLATLNPADRATSSRLSLCVQVKELTRYAASAAVTLFSKLVSLFLLSNRFA